jgi:hypothetical protein
MFSKSLEETISRCYAECRKLRHQELTAEDLLLSLLQVQEVVSLLIALKGNVAALKHDLEVFISAKPILPYGSEQDTKPTLGFQRVLQRAVLHSQSEGLKNVLPVRCLIAIYGEKDSQAVKFLSSIGIDRIDILNFLNHGTLRESPPTSVETINRISRDTPAKTELSNKPKLRLFISYSHKDSSCLDRLMVHLKPLERMSHIDSWSDRKIRPGDKWQKEIAENIEKATVVVLLVSADFLASDFIVTQELPPLLIKAEAKGVRIIPVILKPCGFSRDSSLRSFQCINDPKEPLLGMSEIDREALYDRIVNEIHDELKLRDAVA